MCDGAVGALLRRDAAEEREIAAARHCTGLEQIRRQAVIDGGDEIGCRQSGLRWGLEIDTSGMSLKPE